MAAKTAHQAAKAKAAKEKKLLIVLMVPLLLAGYYAYHTVTKSHQSSSATPPAATTAAASTTSASTAPAATTPSPAATPPPAPPAGKVTSFALLPSRDPFSGGQSSASAPAVSVPPPAATPPPATPKTQAKPKTQPKQTQPKQTQPQPTQPTKTQPTKTQPKKLSPPPKRAVIVLDRMLQRIHLHKGFGYALGDAGQPFFWVLSLTHKAAKLLVAGQAHALILKVDVPKTLTDLHGQSHTLMLLPQGTPLPAAAGQTGVATTTSGSRSG